MAPTALLVGPTRDGYNRRVGRVMSPPRRGAQVRSGGPEPLQNVRLSAGVSGGLHGWDVYPSDYLPE